MSIASSAKNVLSAPWVLRRRLRSVTDLARFPRIAEAELVTLDVFDTALVRTVAHHDDVFTLGAWRAVRRLGLDADVDGLSASRRAAHRLALEAASRAGRSETTLEAIYAHHPITDQTIRAALLAEELATERDLCRANASILALYRALKAQGTRIAFLSDTPFSSAFVRSLLEDAGYPGPLEVYVSSDFGTTKADGGLYRRVAVAAICSPAKMWHIGDNLRSDVLHAREHGVQPLWYRPRLRRIYPTPATGTEESIARSVAAGSRAALTQASPSPLAAIGASVAGPLYLAFVQWLTRDLRRDSIDHVFFLARDAYILKAFYERLRDPALDPPFSYLVVSRRSLVFPLIERLGDNELDFLCSHERPLPVREFFARIGIDIAPHAATANALGLSLDAIVREGADVAALRALFVALAPTVLEAARAERALLLRYLAQEGFTPGGTFALCDVGWNGKSQRALAQVLARHDARSHLDGYYVGTSEAVKRLGATGGTAKGWLVNDGHPRFGVDVSNLSWVLMELIFSAPHDSVIAYRDAGARIAPVFREQLADRGFQDVVAQIQGGALLFLETYKKAFGGLPLLAIDQAEAARALGRLVATPTLAEAEALGDVVMIEGFGDTRTGYAIAAPPPWRSVLERPATLAASYRQALWRRGFAVRVVRSPTIVRALYGSFERLRARKALLRPLVPGPRRATIATSAE